MNFPRRIGLTEIYFDRSRFSKAYLNYVGEKTASYFPSGFMEACPLESTSVNERIVAKEKAFSLLSELKENNNLDIVGGLSSNIFYLEKEIAKKINEADIKRNVFICGNLRKPKVTRPRVSAHEICHIEGLGHEIPGLFRKVFLTLIKGFKLDNLKEFAEINGVIDLTNLENGLMIYSLDYLERDGFSKKDYAHLQNLMRES